MDERTIRSWLDSAEPADDDARAWQAAQALAQERMLSGLAKGDARGLTAWATAAGIASRNVRYATLIARREARREAEPGPAADSEPAWVTALDALDEPRGHLFGAEIRRELLERSEREDPGPPEAAVDLDAILLPQIKRLAALTDDQVRDQLLALEPGWAVHYGWEIPASAEPEPSDLPSGPLDPPQPAPGPSQRPVQAARPPNPGAQVVTAEEQREYESQRQLWRLYGALRGRPA